MAKCYLQGDVYKRQIQEREVEAVERKIRILVAEDFDLLREDLCEFLDSQEDMEAAGSAGGKEEIVKLARKMEFDLILMDIEMEYLTSGIEAAEQILSLIHIFSTT